jgi:hypothetical protein
MASRAGTACGREEASFVKFKASELTILASDVTRRSEA